MSRRSLLLAAAGTGVAGAVTAGLIDRSPDRVLHALSRSASSAYPSVLTGPGITRVERIYSRARGREVDVALVLPSREPPEGMPVSVLLHGRSGSARNAAAPGLAYRLGKQVERGAVPSYGFIAVDGGNSYWHEHAEGDDPLGMLLDEVPRWLRERGLGGAKGLPFAATGTSMGGFGAFLYARRRGEQGDPVDAIAAISPALLTSWSKMRKRKAFDDKADWASMDPLLHLDTTRHVPTAVWCGEQDPFIEGVREFIRKSRPEIGYTARGGHSGRFFRTATPGLISFLGKHTPERRTD
ncbi:alpha/beta hydrolase [Prauserella sp. ASG 168]|uniref:Alpha/beta hydrolase n=1 Tax=Prauserella cavernicola TaxID=2800127 RepID=A0A934QU97_9PSEU|nr:alpha/beta hydrolase [Prauserella cavernicola]